MVAFRPSGTTTWIQTVVTFPDTPKYVFRNESILPFSPYEVKVGVYNNKGEGPFSAVTTVFSAEEGTASSHPKHFHELFQQGMQQQLGETRLVWIRTGLFPQSPLPC